MASLKTISRRPAPAGRTYRNVDEMLRGHGYRRVADAVRQLSAKTKLIDQLILARVAAGLAHPLCHHHITELREGRVGEDALDVILLQGHERGEKSGEGSDPGDDGRGHVGGFDQEDDAGEHEDTRSNHRRGVDESGDGSGALHRIGQPDVEGKLGRFADGTAEDTEYSDVEKAEIGNAADRGFDIVEVDRSGENPDEENPDHETEVTDAVGEKGFFRGVGSRGFIEPVADEEVGADPDEFPEDKHHREVVGEDDARHREHEKRERREVTRLALVVLHVTELEKMHEETDRSHDQHHAAAEAIKLEADREAEVLAGNGIVFTRLDLFLRRTVSDVDPGIGDCFSWSVTSPRQHDAEDEGEERRTRRDELAETGPAFESEENRRGCD